MCISDKLCGADADAAEQKTKLWEVMLCWHVSLAMVLSRGFS